MKLSVIIPIYNEQATLTEIVRRVRATPVEKEIILVDDGSTDKTKEILDRIEKEEIKDLKIFHHSVNQGKGAAVKTGLAAAQGDLTLIQDADLEYDPTEYEELIKPFKTKPETQVVYGSRILKKNERSSFAFYWGGRILSLTTNLLFNSKITDEPTGYKLFKTHLLKKLNLVSNGFEFCPEVTAKILLLKIPIFEVPISYKPRSSRDGKKIKWTDGIRAIWVLLKYRLGLASYIDNNQ